ncbi:Alpha/Beta hydrolase protein [Halteromyces radiatus]|uniref:Alpha/Beta hydrolase protein n=1 Tax=Halteromyces radiatus TaxID=101107 RepID=UPI00222088AA|nr:Alpha/Beta hydrolase protein [Halteromyces radiatus]KAI8081302.1 Alpha/Beta hydrolase protein [Halteromyces radiatus]
MKIWKRGLIGLLIVALQSCSAQKAEDFKISKLPGVDVSKLAFDQYAGHIEVSPETDGNLFFWMLEQVQPTPKKLIIWLNGGPGCSSMDGMFLENGAYRVNPDLSLTINSAGWQDHATVVFLDQPVGTGFSFVNGDGLMHSMTEVAEHFTTFVDKLMDIFPDLKEQDLYLAGESFAGSYIPYFAHRMISINREQENKYNLKGVAVGNGWISPRHQYEAYFDFAVKHNLLEGKFLDDASKHLNDCRKNLSVDTRIHIDVCEDILGDILDNSKHPEGMKTVCINTYDIRLRNETSPACGAEWPYELTDVKEYLRLPELISGTHSEKQALGWKECSSTVSAALRKDTSASAEQFLPEILEDIKVLLFSGEYDLICNHLGTEYMIGNMTWNGERGFKDAVQQDWTIDGKLVGFYTEERNLSYVLIKDGSHMVPYDKPTETLDMINRFMGVGDNKVNGMSSHIGNQEQEEEENDEPVQENEELESPMDNNDDDDDTSSTLPSGSTLDNNTSEQTEEMDDDGLGVSTKSAGSYGALVILVTFIVVGGCWYRAKTRTQHDGKPSIWQRIIHYFDQRPNGKKTKLRLGDQDETNELDELVIEEPTLFAAETYSDSDDHKPEPSKPKQSSPTAFAIADEDDSDDGFDDFADWDEQDALTTNKDGKDH